MTSFSVRRSDTVKRNFILDVFRGLAVVLMMVVDAIPDFQAVGYVKSPYLVDNVSGMM